MGEEQSYIVSGLAYIEVVYQTLATVVHKLSSPFQQLTAWLNVTSNASYIGLNYAQRNPHISRLFLSLILSNDLFIYNTLSMDAKRNALVFSRRI